MRFELEMTIYVMAHPKTHDPTMWELVDLSGKNIPYSLLESIMTDLENDLGYLNKMNGLRFNENIRVLAKFLYSTESGEWEIEEIVECAG